jgi:ADP-ribose pyrophosphatase
MRELKWKVLSSHYVHKGPWATLRVDRCEMPNGRTAPAYYVLEYPDWATAVAITQDHKVLMVRQYRHAAQVVSLEIPGGVIEAGETPEQGLRRELLEETGYEFNNFELLCKLHANPDTANNITHCYLAQGGIKVQGQDLDNQEDIIVEQYSIDEVKQLLADNRITQALHCTTLFYALLKLGKL